jgi:hypothetical protein
MKGLEPSTFCMASRRSSQLSYIREGGDYSPRARPGGRLVDVGRPGTAGPRRDGRAGGGGPGRGEQPSRLQQPWASANSTSS